jgi:hypothetical protein
MPPKTDYTRHVARLTRKLHADAAMGGTAAPDAEYWQQLAKALEEIAEAIDRIPSRD